MNICVVTPYFRTPLSWLQQAHDSVKAQTLPAHHIVVCDGSEAAGIEGFKGSHIILQRNYADYGNTPRLIGCYRAVTRDAEAIAFLDADNWYQPNHLENLVQFARARGLEACSSARMLHRLDGSPLMKCPHVRGQPYIDTSCLLIMKPAFHWLTAWTLFPQAVAAEVDNRLWAFMKANNVRADFLDVPSVSYRTRHAVHYQLAGEAPPPEAVVRADLSGVNYL
jgi:glycosyltransferase involved in cell wall biosynthesis